MVWYSCIFSGCLKPCQSFRGINWVVIHGDCEMYVWSFTTRYLDAGGELLVADSPPIENGYQGPLPTFRSVISIPPVVNRLVLFSPGILHRINPFEGERYSVAVNIWEQAPLTTTAAEPPA